ncbi:hypothetical protein IFM89_038186 [Coptis chinensis]|uniref:Uncharacterized protein n=1 Tax=Coptis chinensis TaxID=261450 RepID=A0A835IA47_9MAGN|nr:hypothetical protein IFM89_038186 [Coptis chinensis]
MLHGAKEIDIEKAAQVNKGFLVKVPVIVVGCKLDEVEDTTERDYSRDKLSHEQESQRNNRSSYRCVKFLINPKEGLQTRAIILGDENKSWGGPKWGDEEPVTTRVVSTWDDEAANDVLQGRSADVKRQNSFGYENKSGRGPKGSDEVGVCKGPKVDGGTLEGTDAGIEPTGTLAVGVDGNAKPGNGSGNTLSRCLSHIQHGWASKDISFYMISVDENLSSRKRWTPTTIQLEKLHQVFDQFNGSPNKEIINNLKAELNQHENDSDEIQVEIQISPKKTKPNNMEETSGDIVPSQEISMPRTSEEEAKINRAKRKEMLNLKSIGNDNYIDDESDDDYLSQMSGSDSDIEVDNETQVSISCGIDVSHKRSCFEPLDFGCPTSICSHLEELLSAMRRKE